MSGKAEGYIAKVFTKSGNSKRGKWVADSFKIHDGNGNEDPFFYQMGFRDKGKLDTPPPFAEGDYITFEYEDKDDSARTFKKGTGRVKQGMAAPAAPAPAKAAGAGGGAQTQQYIHYQNSRTAAVELVGILLENDALPKTGAKTKAGQAARYDEVVGAVNKLTVQFFNDLETFRLLDTVADGGVVDTSADGDLPEDEEELEDDIPFGDEEDDDEPVF